MSGSGPNRQRDIVRTHASGFAKRKAKEEKRKVMEFLAKNRWITAELISVLPKSDLKNNNSVQAVGNRITDARSTEPSSTESVISKAPAVKNLTKEMKEALLLLSFERVLLSTASPPRYRGRCWAAIRLSHRPEPSGRAVLGEVDGLDIGGRHRRRFWNSVERIGDFCHPNPVQYFHCVIQFGPNPVVLSKFWSNPVYIRKKLWLSIWLQFSSSFESDLQTITWLH